jgi:hypothetical protein
LPCAPERGPQKDQPHRSLLIPAGFLHWGVTFSEG